jgi:NarL family two-component system response regulator LiaR
MGLNSHSENENLPQTRIVLADDHPLMLNALKMWIQEQQDLKVIAEARNGKEAVDITLKLRPDLVIMDVNMPVLNGLEATRKIISKYPDTEILIVTVHEDKEHVLSLLQAGASGYLTKNSTGEEIIHAIRTVISGENVLPPNITPSDVSRIMGLTPEKNPELSPRELQFLQLLAEGLANKQIAARLNLSLRRVKANLTTLFTKMGVASRTEAVSSALKSGILTLEDLNK